MSSLLYGAPSHSDAVGVAVGNDAPTVSFNLNFMWDSYPALPFIDLVHSMRTWTGHERSDGWGGMSYDGLIAGGYLDENGWVQEIPTGFDRIGTVWDLSALPMGHESVAGTYVLQYEGEGTIRIGGAEVLSQEDGRIEFRFGGGVLSMDILETDPSGTGDYIRDISIVREDMLPLHEAGALFNPAWLDLVADSRELRFMDWMHANNSDQSVWEDRPQLDNATWTTDGGVPLEVMVRLANETGTDPWFTIPHLADDTYIRNFATYVRDNLDPNLKVHVEFSNEVWNNAFGQAQWAADQSSAEWGVSAPQDYYAKRATETALIWEEVFGTEADARVVHVLGALAAWTGVAEEILDADVWRANEPDSYVAPASVFDELAVTTYFGYSTIGDAALRTELVAVINDPSVDAEAWLADRLLDPDYSMSIPQVAGALAQHSALAEAYGLDLVAYEGGQHVHHSFAVDGLSQSDINALNDFMIDFVRSEEMGRLYEALWDVWVEYGDGPFMQFTDVGTPSIWGSWGLFNYLGDSTPRSEFITEQMAAAPQWWDEASGTQYQQGINYIAGDAGETIVGTDQEDFLAGGDGNDVIQPLGGTDGVNGAGGTDRMLLSGSRGDYAVFEADDGVYFNGPDGLKYVVNVEEVTFETGGASVSMSMADALAWSGDPAEPEPVEPEPVEPEPVEPEPVEPEPVEPEPVGPEPNDPGSSNHNHGEMTGPCPVTGAAVCMCDSEDNPDHDPDHEHPPGHNMHDPGSSMHSEHAAVFDLVRHEDATHVAVNDGFWFDPATWANGEVPGEDARIVIDQGVRVIYDGESDARLFTVRVDGRLDFAVDVDTHMVVDTLVVDTGGTLTIGTEDCPIHNGVTADIVIANNGAIDTEWDPQLLSRGIVSHGEVQIHGEKKTSHIKVAVDPMAGDTMLVLEDEPENWHVGDTLVLAGTNYDGYKWDNAIGAVRHHQPEDEVLTITRIEGNTVYFDRPLEHDHDAPRADLKTSVANYSRSVTIATEDPDTAEVHERGHVMFMHSNDVDVRYAAFHELGRTDKSLDSFNATDIPDIQYDDNARGRYSFHFHRAGTEDQENPAVAIGNAVFGAPGWGFVHHDSHAIMDDNASYNTFGAGFVAETGNETGSWSNNIAIYAQGMGWGDPKFFNDRYTFDLGRSGDGFWFQSRMVESTDNIAASVNNGFVYFSRGEGGNINFPSDVFAYPEALGLRDSVGVDDAPILSFSGNEVFASHEGIQVVKANPDQGHDVHSHLSDFTAWNVVAGATIQYTSHYILDNFDIVGKDAVAFQSPTHGIQIGNNTSDVTISNSQIDGFATGIEATRLFTFPIDPALINYNVANTNISNTQNEFVGLVPGETQFLNQSDIVPGRFEIILDEPLIYREGGGYPGPAVEISGTKIDSLGAVELPGGSDDFNAYKPEVIKILETSGYFRDDAGNNWFVLEDFYTDRGTGEIHKYGHLVRIDPNVQLGGGEYSGAVFRGAIDVNNAAPTALDDIASTAYGTPVVIDLMANDSDPSGDALAVDGIEQPSRGQVFDNGDGTVTYRPDPTFSGTETFRYWVSDGFGNFTPAEVTVEVSADPGPSPVDPEPNDPDPTDDLWIEGSMGDDTLEGGAGNDTIIGAAGDDSLLGQAGDDSLQGGDGSDSLFGGVGEDVIRGGDSGDTLRGERGNDRMGGGQGSDRVVGGEGDDTLRGGNGEDTVLGGDGDDRLFGGRLDDSISGGAGNDEISGQKGDDILNGGAGADTITGGSHNDTISGGTGDDVIDAGTWRDTVTGGDGADFFFLGTNYNRDVITDFTDNEDTLLLDSRLWSGTLSAEEVVDQFSILRDGDVVLDFGQEEFVLRGVSDAGVLVNDIDFV